MISSSPSQTCIDRLKMVILAMTLFFAFIQASPVSQFFVTAPYHPSLLDLLLSPLGACTLNYRALEWQMIFDFLTLNFFVTPLASFVFSFLGQRRFLLFYFASALSSAGFLHLVQSLTGLSFLPTTLFAHAALSILSFWAVLNLKHTTTHFLFIPLQPMTLITISFIATALPSIMDSDWVKLASLIYALAFGYIVATLTLRSFKRKG